jgi:hypothetical protein
VLKLEREVSFCVGGEAVANCESVHGQLGDAMVVSVGSRDHKYMKYLMTLKLENKIGKLKKISEYLIT